MTAEAAANPISGRMFERAARVLPGGVGSSARMVRAGWKPYPPFVASAEGSKVTDVDGNVYIDYLLGLGPMLLGHRNPDVTAAVVKAISERGTVFGLPHELEAEAAEKVVAAVPSIDMVRFCNSGSEAVGTAVRLARAATGRPYILRFEGHYHGWMDTVYWSNHPKLELAGPDDAPVPVAAGAGMAPHVGESLLILQWNDLPNLERIMAERGHEIAGIITEPMMLNTGCIMPIPGYLERMRELATKHGSVLIFDEVITGFRLSRGGGQQRFGVTPDLTTMAKGIAGGFPVAAIGGKRELMEMVGDGRYSHSGTYNSNVLGMAAVSATMDVLARPGTYEELDRLSAKLLDGFKAAAERHGIAHEVQGVGPVGQIWFTDAPIRTYRDAVRHAQPDRFAFWWRQMMDRGVLFHPSQDENLFVSTAHTDADIDRTLEAADAAMAAVAAAG